MAAGAGTASGASLEATLEKKFRNVTNTMDSIQGLSTWCLDNKKYHSLIVRHWMKCLRKSNAPHRLNLLYLANDVIQNCKRKNAIVYRTAFAEVLPDAFLLVNQEGDPKVIRSVERILSIWEERDVYSGTLITDLRNTLVKEESPPETPVEQNTPVESKADLQSKIVAEFVPQAFIDQLSKYKRSLEEVDLREKQLAAMRVDIFSSEALKKLKDKAGGKKFSKDFEEGSAQMQEFVKFFDKQNKIGPPLLEALSNADIFYELQYKEVKIVANAYQTFANRVSHLKRKLDALKATLPDLDESPIPSPSADAPSPTGSESPFHGMELAHPDPELDGSAMDDDAEPPAPSPLSSPGGSPQYADTLGEIDNCEVEDMELSDEEMGNGGIIVEEQIESVCLPEVSGPIPAKSKASVTEPAVLQATPSAAAPAAAPAAVPAAAPAAVPAAVPAAAPAFSPAAAPAAIPAAAIESVDMSKISSILSSITPGLKTTGLVDFPTAAPVMSSVKPKPVAPVIPQDATSLVSLLSKVDVSPADLLSALSKVQSQSSLKGITSLLSPNVGSDPPPADKSMPSSSSTSSSVVPSQTTSPSFRSFVPPSTKPAVQQSSSAPATPETLNKASALVQALHRDMDLTTEQEPSASSSSLESKIHNFLQGNPAFSAFDLKFSAIPVQGAANISPVTGTENQDGTPVRDEGGGTPTQDEIMDKPVAVPIASGLNQSAAGEAIQKASVMFENPNNPFHPAPPLPGVAQNGQRFQAFPYGKREVLDGGMAAPVALYQQLSVQVGGDTTGHRAPGGASSTPTAEGFRGVNEQSRFGDGYPAGGSQPPGGYGVLVPGGGGENKTSGLYPYPAEQGREPRQGFTASPSFFKNTLPPVPKLPPPPPFDVLSSLTSGVMRPPEQEPVPSPGMGGVVGNRMDSIISGMVVHDHQHKSSRPDDPFYDSNRPLHLEDPYPHPDNDLRYQEDLERYHGDNRQHDPHFFHNDPYYPPDDAFFRPGSPPHPHQRVRGQLTPPLSPSGDPFFSHDYQQRSPPPHPHYAPRRPPPHHEIHRPGLRPPHRPPRPGLNPHPRGPPRQPFPRFRGPEPRLRGKRAGPRGGGPMFLPKRPFLPPRF
uniref:Regulation of nuclear pre-mRNA domain-containing protein 2 n=2 Tax=Nothobranchius korthausae TaxID=1143690 RepID=A0A1A8ENJ5_9TELE